MRFHRNIWSNIHFICLFLSVVTIIICIFTKSKFYEWIFALPFTFFICSSVLYSVRKNSITVSIFYLCSFLRYVLLPAMQSLFPVYGFSSYSCTDEEIINKAIALMCYELVFITVFIALYQSTHKRSWFMSLQNSEPNLLNRFDRGANHYGAVMIFVLIACALVVIKPNTLQQISFIAIRSNTVNRIGIISASSSTLDMISRQFFVIGFLSLFVICALKFKQSKMKKSTALNLSLFFAAICTSIIIAEQRSSQVYCAFAAIILLVQLYPNKRAKIVRTIGIVFLVVILLLSAYKTFYAFKYGSYSEAIAHSSFSPCSLTQTLEIYLLGPQTVSSAIQFQMENPSFSNFSKLLFDICRSTIGLSFFVKSGEHSLTSARYNLFVTRGVSESGYLLPITAQGYLVLGVVLAPVLICLFYWLAFKTEKKIFNSRSAYVTFFSAYVYIRLATCIVSSNINTVLNSLSSIMISAGLVYLIQFSITKMTHRGLW